MGIPVYDPDRTSCNITVIVRVTECVYHLRVIYKSLMYVKVIYF